MKKMDKLRIKSIYFPIVLGAFHVAFIVLMGVFGKYKIEKEGDENSGGLYAMFMDVHSMMFIGFGFLMTFIKRYSFSGVGFNFLVAAFVLEWSLLVRGWFEASLLGSKDAAFEISIENLLYSDFCAAAVLISFGAVLGTTSLSQLIAIATIEVVLQSVNEYIGLTYIKAYDVGESMYVHAFGAYFGLAVAKILQINRNYESKKESSIYHSDLFSIIGTIFLWLYWPSFNAAMAVDEGQLRAIVNTFLAITASCIATYVVSLIVGKGKLNMIHVQNATLAGGVAVGAVSDMAIEPYGAMIIGTIAGIVSTLGFQYLTPFLNHKFVHDSCGVNNLHGMPGIISGITSAIVASIATMDRFHGIRLFVFYPSRIPVLNSVDFINLNLTATEFANGGDGRSPSVQAGFQLAALALTLAIAICGGLLTGLIIKLPIFEQVNDADEAYEDDASWLLPEDVKKTSIDSKPNQVENVNEITKKSIVTNKSNQTLQKSIKGQLDSYITIF